MKKILFAGLLLVSCLTIVSAQVKMSFNPAKGAKYEFQIETTQNIKQNMMGQDIPIEMVMNFKYLMEIKDKTPQEAQVLITYKEVTYNMSSPMMKMGYSSVKPVDNPSQMDMMMGKIFSSMIDKSFTLTIAPDGTVKSVTGMEAIADGMTKAISADGQQALQMGEQMKQQFSGNTMKTSFEQLFQVYPDNAVKAGDSWNKDNSMMADNMKVDSKAKYTLKSLTGNMANIAVESTIEMTPQAGMEGKLSGTQTGTMVVDTATGLPVSGDSSLSVKGQVSAQGMDVQMELSTKAKTSIKEVK